MLYRLITPKLKANTSRKAPRFLWVIKLAIKAFLMSLINSIVQHVMNFQPFRSNNPRSEVLKRCRAAEEQRCGVGVCPHTRHRAHSALLGTLLCQWVFSVFTALIQCLVLGQLPPGHNFISPFRTLFIFFFLNVHFCVIAVFLTGRLLKILNRF